MVDFKSESWKCYIKTEEEIEKAKTILEQEGFNFPSNLLVFLTADISESGNIYITNENGCIVWGLESGDWKSDRKDVTKQILGNSDYMEDFDLVGSPWFIRTSSQAEFYAAQEWLNVNYGSNIHESAWEPMIEGFTNIDSLSPPRVIRGWYRIDSNDVLIIPKEYEIKLEIEVKVKSVTFPEETQEQKEIKRLKSIIKDAQESLDEIYKGGQK